MDYNMADRIAYHWQNILNLQDELLKYPDFPIRFCHHLAMQ
jgi:hypothetical protein